MTNEINLTLRRNDSGILVKIPEAYYSDGSQYYAMLLPHKVSKSLTSAVEEAIDFYNDYGTESLDYIYKTTVDYLTEVLEVLKVREYIEDNQK